MATGTRREELSLWRGTAVVVPPGGKHGAPLGSP